MFQLLKAHRATRFARTILFAGAAPLYLGVAACSGGGGPTAPSSGGKVTGTYSLEYADDEELPVAVHRGAYLDPATGVFYNNFVFEVTGGYIEIRENETFYAALQVRITADGQGGQGTFDFEGEWDEVKDEIVLRIQWPFVATTSMERDGNWLTTNIDFLGLGEETELEFDLWKR
jgi:hypothetical protein